MMVGIEMVHVPMCVDLRLGDPTGGQVQLFFGSHGVVIEPTRSGSRGALAVTMAMRRRRCRTSRPWPKSRPATRRACT